VAVVEVLCIHCKTKEVVKNGKSTAGIQRYACLAESCGRTFQLTHCYNAYQNGIKDRIVDMALNGSGVRDSARVLSVAVGTVISTLKKSLQSD
jgi:transposase